MESSQTKIDLREQFFWEAKNLVREFEQRDDIRAAILTGSAAWGNPNPDGDLDILLIVKGENGVVFRYLLPIFCPVPRRSEFGFLPYDEIDANIEKAYGSKLSGSTIEQLKNGRVLFQNGSEGDRLIERCRQVRPAKAVVGKFINNIVKAYGGLRDTDDFGEEENHILLIRKVARLCAKCLLLARENTGVTKDKHELKMVRKFLGKEEKRNYEKLLGIIDINANNSRKAVKKTVDLIKWLLDKRSLSANLVKYDYE